MKRELDGVPPEETETSKKVCAVESEEQTVAISSVSAASAADGTMSAADDRDADDASARGEADNAMSAAAAAATSSEEAASAAEAAAAASTVPSCASATPSFAAGHDGTFAAAAAPDAPAPTPGGLSDEELARQLQARADAKNRRDFTTSDSIRMQLEQHGIRIVDGRSAGGMGTWSSADGRRYASHGCHLGISRRLRALLLLPHQLTPSPHPAHTHPHPSTPGSGNTAGPNFFLDPYAQQPSSQAETPPGATISNEELVAQLRARAEAKMARDFATSDSIRAALEAKGIRITDGTRGSSGTWVATDGRSGNTIGPDFLSNNNNMQGPPRGPPQAYGAPGPYGGPYGYGGPPPSAYGGYGYGASPPAMMPAGPTPRAHAAGPGYLPTEVIFSMLGEREAARIAKDYARSDVMREELLKGGVRVEDKLKTWTATDGRSGTITRPEAGGGTCCNSGGGGAYSQPTQPAAGHYGQDQQHQQGAWAAAYQAQAQQYAGYWQYPGGPGGGEQQPGGWGGPGGWGQRPGW